MEAARATAWLGGAWAAAGWHRRAEELLIEALEEFRAVGSDEWHGRVLEMLGQTAEGQDQHEKVRELYARALEVVEAADLRDAARIRQRLADAVAASEAG
ncbi:tetratricopeptide repeat protein [Streptomyces sp. 8N114]|uniref:tetratricopeptide repeat protein n=1 Tax=Streptomyces sp. 8N114 TaxID=3457419 RepID=UPI003FD6B8EF